MTLPTIKLSSPQRRNKLEYLLYFLQNYWRQALILPFVGILFAIGGWVFLNTKLDQEYSRVTEDALKNSATLARGNAEQIGRILEALDQTALHIRYDWELSGGHLKLVDASKKGLFPASSEYIFYAAIIDSDGKLLTDTQSDANIGFFAHRSFFSAHVNTLEDKLFISEPIVGPFSGRVTLFLSRKIIDSNGGFGGIVLLAIAPEYLTANYDYTALGPNGFSGVVGNSDSLIRTTRIGPHVLPHYAAALSRLPRFDSNSGAAHLDGQIWYNDKRDRFVGWQQVKGYPLTAYSGLDANDTLAAFLERRQNAQSLALFAITGMLALVMVATVLSTRLAIRKRQLKLTQATYRMATEEGDEGFYIAHPVIDSNERVIDLQAIDCNQRGADLFGRRRTDLIGRYASELYTPRVLARLLRRVQHAMDRGFYEREIIFVTGDPMQRKWGHLKMVRSGCDLAITLRDVSEAKSYLSELRKRSNEDSLTNLPNRHWAQNYLPEAIDRASANNLLLACLFVDLDGFKAVNDTLGHSIGDELLKHAARRLRQAVRPRDKVVRLGGDEFIVIIEDIFNTADAGLVAERVLHAFAEGFKLSDRVYSIGTSIGISVAPLDGSDAATLLKNADIAMYSVKTTGKGTFRFYEPSLYERRLRRLEDEQFLREAIDNDQFIMYYQPRIAIATGRTASMEALVRWNHPTRGLVSPLDFVPLAEETGLILDLGELIIQKVCAQLAHWCKTGQFVVPVSINVSPRQFNETDVVRTFADCLSRYSLDPSLVEIEVTEASMMGESEAISQTISTLQRMGIKLAIDDFGTGYSSLSQLQRLDFDVLKVDQTFTAQIEKSDEGRVFFTAIITMAHALGMKVVAEGVDNERQLSLLRHLNCDEIQGFYISKPIPTCDVQPSSAKSFLPMPA